MKLVVAGGSGFLGRSLAAAVAADGGEVIVLTRTPARPQAVHGAGAGVPGIMQVGWQPDGQVGEWARHIDGADAVVNLAGESLAAGRWTPLQKMRLRDSRVLATRSLAGAILAASRAPRVLVNGSAIGYYGFVSGDAPCDESCAGGDDFLARLVADWEQEARRAERPGTRVVLVRTGLVLAREGGVLPRMLLPFRLFAGGPVGSGGQYMSWIHKRDWLDLVRWVIDTPTVTGPINATAPEPVTNRAFARALGHAMGRPSLMPVPGFVLRLTFGEMADALLLGGQRAMPTRLLQLGFAFRYPNIDRALGAILKS